MSLDLSMWMREDAHLERPRAAAEVRTDARADATSALRLMVAAVVVTFAGVAAAMLVATDDGVVAWADSVARPPCVATPGSAPRSNDPPCVAPRLRDAARPDLAPLTARQGRERSGSGSGGG